MGKDKIIYNSIVENVFEENQELPTSKWLNIKKDYAWHSLSLEDFKELVLQTACYLKSIGVKKGVRVGVISISSPHWIIFDHSILILGAINIPLFPNASHDNLNFIIKQTGLKYLFCHGEEAYKSSTPFINKLKKIIIHEIDSKKLSKKLASPKIINFSDVLVKGKTLLKNNQKIVLANLKKIKPKDLATIVYTSGSLGIPKGVMLTHENILNQIKSCEVAYPLNPMTDKIVTFLPLAHIFERSIIYFYLAQKVPVYFSPRLTQIGDIIREIKPTVMTTIPRLLHKIYEKIYFNIKSASKFKNLLARNAIRRAETKETITPKTFLDKIYERLVYQKLRNSLGGKHRLLISGGAALDRSLYRFFFNIGIPLYEGYGMTETSPVISANTPENNEPYSVGKVFKNVKVKLAKDGEILVKGPSIMKGYFKSPLTTKATFTKDNWLKTGDLGRINKEGFLFITSRKKEMFKNISGKYITPAAIEEALSQNPYIELALVIGNNRKFVTALLFLNNEYKNVLKEEEIQEELKKVIDRINNKFNPWEKIIRYKTTWDILKIDNGELTPKMSIRREVLMKKYKKLIEQLY